MSFRESRTLLPAVGVFLLPIATLQLAAAFLVSDTSSAAPSVRVAHNPVEQPAPAPVERNWSERERVTAEHVTALAGMDFGPTPFYYVPLPSEPEPAPVVEAPAPQPAPPAPEPPLTAEIRAIIVSRGESIALINGRQRRVGDTINEGRWQIVAMSSDTRTVTFEHFVTGERQVRDVLGP